jgi:hypothetical protein
MWLQFLKLLCTVVQSASNFVLGGLEVQDKSICFICTLRLGPRPVRQEQASRQSFSALASCLDSECNMSSRGSHDSMVELGPIIDSSRCFNR